MAGEGPAQQPFSPAGSAHTCTPCVEPRTAEEPIPGAQRKWAQDPYPDISSALRAV